MEQKKINASAFVQSVDDFLATTDSTESNKKITRELFLNQIDSNSEVLTNLLNLLRKKFYKELEYIEAIKSKHDYDKFVKTNNINSYQESFLEFLLQKNSGIQSDYFLKLSNIDQNNVGALQKPYENLLKNKFVPTGDFLQALCLLPPNFVLDTFFKNKTEALINCLLKKQNFEIMVFDSTSSKYNSLIVLKDFGTLEYRYKIYKFLSLYLKPESQIQIEPNIIDIFLYVKNGFEIGVVENFSDYFLKTVFETFKYNEIKIEFFLKDILDNIALDFFEVTINEKCNNESEKSEKIKIEVSNNMEFIENQILYYLEPLKNNKVENFSISVDEENLEILEPTLYEFCGENREWVNANKRIILDWIKNKQDGFFVVIDADEQVKVRISVTCNTSSNYFKRTLKEALFSFKDIPCLFLEFRAK